MVTSVVVSAIGENQSVVATKASGSENKAPKLFANSLGQELSQGVSTAPVTMAILMGPKTEVAPSLAEAHRPVFEQKQPQELKSDIPCQLIDNMTTPALGMRVCQSITSPQDSEDESVDHTQPDNVAESGTKAPKGKLQIGITPYSTLVQPPPSDGFQHFVEPHYSRDPKAVQRADTELVALPKETRTKGGGKTREVSVRETTIVKDISPAVMPILDNTNCVSNVIQPSLASGASVMSIDVQACAGQVATTSMLQSILSNIPSKEIKYNVTTVSGAENMINLGVAYSSLDSHNSGTTLARELDTSSKSGIRVDGVAAPSRGKMDDSSHKQQDITAPIVVTHETIVASSQASDEILFPANAHTALARMQGSSDGIQIVTLRHEGEELCGPGPASMTSTTGVVHKTLIATPAALEVAIPNGSQGWLKVRAETASGGGINASLTATSSSGQEMLHQELPSLAAYLQQERIGVNAVVVHATIATRTWSGQSSPLNRGMSDRRQQDESRREDNQPKVRSAAPSILQARNIVNVNEVLLYAANGNWLSVRA